MKIRPTSTHQPTSDTELTDYQLCQQKKPWEHPWNSHMLNWDAEEELDKRIKRPNPPTKEAIQKAKFIDKSFAWRNNARI